MMLESETFVQLLRSPGHWLFEIFLMVLFDGVIGRRHWEHHVTRDNITEVS